MLTSFFSKSAPLNFVLLSGYILVISLLHFVFNQKAVYDTSSIIDFVGAILILIFSILLLDFIIRKNGLTKLNTYAIFIFACAVGLLSGFLFAPKIILVNVFILLALRRMFSLQNPKNNERKILDASIWILCASAFYFWNILLLAPLFLAISLKSVRSIRYYLIPIVGAVGVFLVATAYHFLMGNSFSWFATWITPISFDFLVYSDVQLMIFISLISVMIVWTLVPKIKMISKGAKKERPNYILEIAVLATMFIVIVISSEKSGAELLLIIAPVAIIIAGYLERASEIWFKEILLWVFVLTPIITVFV